MPACTSHSTASQDYNGNGMARGVFRTISVSVKPGMKELVFCVRNKEMKRRDLSSGRNGDIERG